MKRAALSTLIDWKQDSLRKPMLMMGARQVGKTWLMQEFGKKHFRNTVYVRFDLDKLIKQNFEQDLDVKRLLSVLQLHGRKPIIPGETLIILDEIQECPHALTALKYFCEEAREYHIIAAGSLLGLNEHHGTGFPVGKVDMMTLYPLSFSEFLQATGNEMFADLLDSRDTTLINGFAPRLTELLKTYYFVGGMPEAVSTYVQSGDFLRVRKIQTALLNGYRKDFSKHAPGAVSHLISQIWNSIALQLSRENKKFLCKDVQPGMRMRQLEDAMQWLADAGLIYQISRISKPAVPIAAYKERAFKLFYLDVGLLSAMCGLSAKVLLEPSRIFSEFKGALAEQFVQQELRLICEEEPVYWVSESNQAEIDFIIQQDAELIPIEVKAEVNLKAKSLKTYCKKFQVPTAVRLSLANWNEQEMPIGDSGENCRLLNLPLYATGQLIATLTTPKEKG